MKAKDIKLMTKEEVHSKAAELRGSIRDLRFKIKTRENAKVRILRLMRRDLARVLTAIPKD